MRDVLLLLIALAPLIVDARGGRGGGGRGSSGGRSGGRSGGGGRSSGGRSGSGGRFGGGSSGSRPAPFSFGGTKYRGNSGVGAPRSSPAITGAGLATGIFASRSFLFIHGARAHYGGGGGGRAYGAATVVQEDEAFDNSTNVELIDRPELPFLVDGMAFFWDKRYLPREGMPKGVFDLNEYQNKEAASCKSLPYSNTNDSTYSLCDVETTKTCSRSLSYIADDRFKSLAFSDGTSPTELAWLCPAASPECCEWECCAVEEGAFYEDCVILVGFIALFGYCLYQSEQFRRCRARCLKSKSAASPTVRYSAQSSAAML